LFTSAVSQIIEQKAEWLSFAQTGEHYNKAGTEILATRTRNAKSILVIGSGEEFSRSGRPRDENVMRDTFELFRREIRSIDIVTFDELLERARFITRSLACYAGDRFGRIADGGKKREVRRSMPEWGIECLLAARLKALEKGSVQAL
jgi:hypothetical protein